jgi:hypothetical protein
VRTLFDKKKWPSASDVARQLTGQPFHGLIDLLFMSVALLAMNKGNNWGVIALPLIFVGVAFRVSAQLQGETRANAPLMSGVYRFCRMPYSFGSYLIWTGLSVLCAEASLQFVTLVIAGVQIVMFLRFVETKYLAAKDPVVARYVALTSLLLPQISPTPGGVAGRNRAGTVVSSMTHILKRDRGLLFGLTMYVLASFAANSQPLYRNEIRLIAFSLLLLMAVRSFVRDFARKNFRADARIYP